MLDGDEFDDIFKIMDRAFGVSDNKSNISEYIDIRASERIMDKDKVYYTFVLKGLEKNDISVDSHKDRIELLINCGTEDDRYVVKTPYPIIPDKTIAKYNNGLLDITTFIDEVDINRVEIQ